MSSFITTPCPGCGPADIGIEHVVLHIDEDTERTSISVCCPGCGARFVKPIDDGMSVLLVTVGVEVQTSSRPAEVDERPSNLPPITPDELEAFAQALDRADDLERFASGR